MSARRVRARSLRIRHGPSGALIFTPGRGHDRLNSCGQASVEIAGFEARRNFVVNDAFAGDVRQRAFQAITDL